MISPFQVVWCKVKWLQARTIDRIISGRSAGGVDN